MSALSHAAKCCAGLLAAALMLPAMARPVTLTLTAELTHPAVTVQAGRVTGHAAEKVHEIMRRSEIDYTMATMPWRRAYTLALNQDATCVFMTTRTPERETLFHWIGPISQADWVLYGRADRQYDVKTLEQVRGMRIGSYNGDVRGEFLAARGFNVDFVQNDESNPKKLLLDRIDLWVNSTRSSQPLLAKLGLLGKVAPVLSFNQAKLYLACNRAVPEPVAARMQAALRSMEADGTYKAIEQRYEYLHEQASKPQSERSSTNSSFQHLENLK
jgi:polar amino acid transport system substrate-binding protein